MIERKELERGLQELRPRLHRYCARMTGSVVDGEDVLQEALMKALAAFEHSDVANLKRWLFRIAHNAAYDHLRKRATRREISAEADMAMVHDPAARADSRHAAALSMRTFMHLPVTQRSAVILVDVLGLSLQEAGEVTGATLAATKAALHRGRMRLQAIAADELEPPALVLSTAKERRLRRYIDLFNARDFDAIRDLIGEEVQLELVDSARMSGRTQASTYFGNYALTHDWRLSLGLVDGTPALLVHDPANERQRPWSFILLEWEGGKVVRIRDFRHARHVLAEAEVEPLS